MAAFTHVCVYDRPGTYVTTVEKNGARAALTSADSVTAARGTAVVSAPRTGGDVVAELHQLLAAAHVPGPYVLVGHSIGGLFSLLYARTYPDQVSGMVLVDPTAPQLRQLVSPAQWALFERSGLDPGQSLIPGYVERELPHQCHPRPARRGRPDAANPRHRPHQDHPRAVPRAAAPTRGPPRTMKPSRRRYRPRTPPSSRASPARNSSPCLTPRTIIHGERPDVVISAIRATTAGTTMTSTPTP